MNVILQVYISNSFYELRSCTLPIKSLLGWRHGTPLMIIVLVMAWWRQATSHYLNKCWPSSIAPYGVTRTKWVNTLRPREIHFQYAFDVTVYWHIHLPGLKMLRAEVELKASVCNQTYFNVIPPVFLYQNTELQIHRFRIFTDRNCCYVIRGMIQDKPCQYNVHSTCFAGHHSISRSTET